jgi:hypothetical protein
MNRLPVSRRTPCRAAARKPLLALASALVAVPLWLFDPSPAHAQAAYRTPDDAAAALANALAINDQNALKHVLGNNYEQFIPSSTVSENDVYDFLGAWSKGHEIVNDPEPLHGHPSAHLAVGQDGWTLPIPLVKTSAGWRFDPASGRDEILTRRIGRNERAAMMTSLAYIDAQNDYHKMMQHYAERIISKPGTHDGLYWDAGTDEPASPLGPLAEAMGGTLVPGEGYHGYHFRILTAQGSHASGGARNYVEDGKFDGGFGLVAWPVDYGKTGVMSFIVNQDGQLYQKNLGPQTSRAAAAIRSFDPDASWQATQP